MTYIEIIDAGTSPSGLTRRFNVTTKGGDMLGEIHWHSPWRKYIFAPRTASGYEEVCLREIADYLELQTRMHSSKAKMPV